MYRECQALLTSDGQHGAQGEGEEVEALTAGGGTEGLFVFEGGECQAAEGEEGEEGEVHAEGVDVKEDGAEGQAQHTEYGQEEEEG